MSYYGARAAFADFGSFGVVVIAFCLLCVAFTFALMAAVVWAVVWAVWSGVKWVVERWRNHAA